MMDIDLNLALTSAKKIAVDAGNHLLKYKDTLNEQFFSTDKDIKLKADLMAEKRILKSLSTFSSIPILSEEAGASDNLSDTYWVVDPLDGTANYSRNIPISAVSIALMSNLIPILGVIYDFHNNELYEGSINSKACLNEEEIYVSDTQKSSDGILITGLPNNTDFSDDALIKMVKNFQTWRKIRMIGSASMASAYVASGKADMYMEHKTYIWDVAAGAAIVNAAGGEALISNYNDKFQVDAYFSNSIIKV